MVVVAEKIPVGAKNYKISERQRKYGVWYHSVNKEERNRKAKEKRDADPDKQKNRKLLQKFGITLEQYKDMLTEQNGLCKICGNPEIIEGRGLAVDHNHVTGKVRGLLCFKCNVTIGHIEKTGIEVLHKMLAYLEKEDSDEPS